MDYGHLLESRAHPHRGTPSIEGSPVDLRLPGWEAHQEQEGQVVMLTEAQLQRFLHSYGQNVPRDGKFLSRAFSSSCHLLWPLWLIMLLLAYCIMPAP